jgi:hypothetical protein
MNIKTYVVCKIAKQIPLGKYTFHSGLGVQFLISVVELSHMFMGYVQAVTGIFSSLVEVYRRFRGAYCLSSGRQASRANRRELRTHKSM